MSINMGSIMGKVRAYANSPEGKARMKSYVNGQIASGKTTTDSGAQVVNLAEMEGAAAALANMVISAAASSGVPGSVMAAVSSISSTAPYKVSDTGYRIDLFFTANLHRESLYSEGYDGVHNIIALFNNGYMASNTVYGLWHGKNIRSKIAREPLDFMQSAVSQFNASYGGTYHAVATLSGEYS